MRKSGLTNGWYCFWNGHYWRDGYGIDDKCSRCGHKYFYGDTGGEKIKEGIKPIIAIFLALVAISAIIFLLGIIFIQLVI